MRWSVGHDRPSVHNHGVPTGAAAAFMMRPRSVADAHGPHPGLEDISVGTVRLILHPPQPYDGGKHQEDDKKKRNPLQFCCPLGSRGAGFQSAQASISRA